MARFFKTRLPGVGKIPDRVRFEVQLTPAEQKQYGVKMGEGNKKVLSAQEYCELYAKVFGHPPADAALLHGKLKSETRVKLEAERTKLAEKLDRLDAQVQKTVTAEEASKVGLMDTSPPATPAAESLVEPEIPSEPMVEPDVVKPKRVARKKAAHKRKKSKAKKK